MSVLYDLKVIFLGAMFAPQWPAISCTASSWSYGASTLFVHYFYEHMLFKFGIVCSLLQQFVFVLYTLDISGRNWGAFPPIHSFMQFADLTVTNQKKILTCLNWFASVCWLLLDISPLYLHCCCSVAQSCPTFCDPMDCSPPGSSVYGIFQARILEWAAISFSQRSFWTRDWTRVSRIVGRHFTIWATREVINQ